MFNIDFLNNISVASAAAIPIILSITQALKFTSWVKDKYAPFVSILVGIGISFLLIADPMIDLSNTILSGILFGLSASGLYSGLKTTQVAIKQERAERMEKRNARLKHNHDR